MGGKHSDVFLWLVSSFVYLFLVRRVCDRSDCGFNNIIIPVRVIVVLAFSIKRLF